MLFDARRTTEAIDSLREAARLCPDASEIHYNLATCHQRLGNNEDAIVAFRRALSLRPHFPAAHHNLGVVLQSWQDFAAAAECHRAAVSQKPDFVEAHVGLATALNALRRRDEAEGSFRRAIELDPANARTLFSWGSALHQWRRLDEAELAYKACLRLEPRNVQAHYNLAACLQVQGRIREAIEHLELVLTIDPNYRQAQYFCGTLYLLLGDFARGWPLHEARSTNPPDDGWHRQARWNGEELRGQRIVLHAEGGLGDTMHFIRYAPLVRQRGGDVVLEVQPALIPLLRQSGLAPLLPLGAEISPPCQYHASLVSLPMIFGTTFDTIPAQIPYLWAEEGLIRSWGDRLKPYTGLKVGIHWLGSDIAVLEGRRIALREFEVLARVPGVTLISLHKSNAMEEVAALADRFRVVDFGDELDTIHGAFMDTAAIMKNVDLVITCDTATAHLAGAMGVPVWIALMLSGDWRWLLDRENSPWYPTARLFRQTAIDDWTGVFVRMAGELARLAATRSGP
jgi:tetratricopeptide (TPR) repeat protein